MFDENKKKKGFFEVISAKSSFILGLVVALLIVGTIGFFVLLVSNGDGKISLPGMNKTEYNQNSLASKLELKMKDFRECLDSSKYVDKVQSQFEEGISAGITGTPGVYVNEYLVKGAYPYEAFKDIIDDILAGRQVVIDDAPEIELPTEGAANLKPVTEADHYLGDINAPIKLIEFSDFQCPYCSRVHPTLQQLVDDYNGQVVWIYRHYPLDQLHPYSRTAAEASECAAEQDMFWEYADALFENQALITSEYISY